MMRPNSRSRFLAFTLIELLIVVAIIAILAAIAVPNFLEAQTRSKVSRVKADMRAIATGVEAYYVDNNAYPTGYGIIVKPGELGRHSLFLLSTPVAYMTSGNIQDPFVSQQSDEAGYTTIQWDPLTEGGRMTSDYNVSLNYVTLAEKTPWWILISNGPDLKMGFGDYNPMGGPVPDDPESNVQTRLRESNTNLQAFVDTIYDPTNGTVSVGNIYRAGGGMLNAGGRAIK